MINSIVAEHSLLFLGSGFSTEATNRLEKAPPTGNSLKRTLANRAGVDPNNYSLTDLAEYCANKDAKAFYDLIRDSFRITKLSPSQRDILSAPWMRIYTTNFDDAAELGRTQAGLQINSFSFQTTKPRRVDLGSIVHLHGVVRDVTEENALEQIVLGETAYVRQHLEKSAWYDQFLYDLKFASACFFLGYSLSDQHIAALLLSNPLNISKVFFVEPDRIPDKIFASRIEKYGEIEPIGLDGFADLTRMRLPPPPLTDLHALKSFKLLETHPDKKAATKPTVNEVRDFLVHGKLSLARLFSSLPQPIYAVPRDEDAMTARTILENNRSLIVDARLGNGKSVFEYILFSKLAEKGYKCLLVKNVDSVPQAEIDFLNSQVDVVIFFESYAVAQTLLDPLSQSLPRAKFVVEVRSSLFEVRLFEIEAKVPRPYGRLSLNKLRRKDRSDFLEVCRSAGVVPRGVDANNESTELRDLLISVFQSEAIRDKIKNDLNVAMRDENAKRIVVVVFLMQLVQAEVDPDFLRLVTGVDPFEALRLNIEGSEEIFSLADNNIALRSSIFAEYAMQEFVATSDLSDAVHDCAVFCANRKEKPRYRTLLTMFVQYSRIRPMFRRRHDAAQQMRSLYERLRWYPNIKDEPLFWLQFAILEIDEGHLSDAKKYIDFSYEEASKRRGFLTYQIDTQYFRLLLDVINTDSPTFDDSMFEDFVRLTSVVGTMLAEDSHRFFIFDNLERLPEAVIKIRGKLSDGERLALRASIQNVTSIISSSSPDFLAQTGASKLASTLSGLMASLE